MIYISRIPTTIIRTSHFYRISFLSLRSKTEIGIASPSVTKELRSSNNIESLLISQRTRLAIRLKGRTGISSKSPRIKTRTNHPSPGTRISARTMPRMQNQIRRTTSSTVAIDDPSMVSVDSPEPCEERLSNGIRVYGTNE